MGRPLSRISLPRNQGTQHSTAQHGTAIFLSLIGSLLAQDQVVRALREPNKARLSVPREANAPSSIQRVL